MSSVEATERPGSRKTIDLTTKRLVDAGLPREYARRKAQETRRRKERRAADTGRREG